ncbi:MAG: DEAD/DEAH box helicase [Methylococcales bacterium]|jgi:DEAD/DEAH box helicase domain-containing protein|nr:DEAD/DEAH box helicase [Methylococcales bacterium]MBT7445555.1 DEAD/DEAH box helicase [Methylococcales bacterium]
MNEIVLPKNLPFEQLLAEFKEKNQQQITGEIIQPEKPGCYSPFPDDVHEKIKTALINKGIKQLYSHQQEAWLSVQQKTSTVIVTPTASGKTLCYNLPVLHGALTTGAKALYLFPTKALSQDQVAEISELNKAGDLGVKAFTFDGDTPSDARKAVRTRGDIVVTNPDMLHQGILPHHTKWAQFFEQLNIIVIDEMHTYRGVFGSHMANVLRRLQRICAFYGSQPTFVLCSATIANPEALAEQLTGQPVTAIKQSGAPQGKKHLLLWNPPVVNAELGIRASARSQSTRIAKTMINNDLKSIIFCQSRLMVEVITKYLKDQFDRDLRKPARIKAYRGGYLPTERRDTEKKLRNGAVDCVISTSALELGVDIGSLDVCILNGYPGTIAGTWQRVGRAGRRHKPALAVLVASSQLMDQYIVQTPEYFLEAGPEHARIDPDQLLILLDHIRCAAFELPFSKGDEFGGKDVEDFLALLTEDGVIHYENQQWHWMDDSYPAGSVNLRSGAEGDFVVIDITKGKKDVIAEVDFSSAPVTIYEGAIYLIQAKPWQVERLDWEGRKAFVKTTEADYYTDAIDYTKLKILEEFELQAQNGVNTALGEVHVVRRITGYKKIRYYTHENVGFGKIQLPDQEMHTSSVWWQISHDALQTQFSQRWEAIDGFIGAAYAVHFVAALLTMTEKRDISRSVGNSDSTWYAALENLGSSDQIGAMTRAKIDKIPDHLFQPTLFLYDSMPGGIGLSGQIFKIRQQVIDKARQLILKCVCAQGCPACIGPMSTEPKPYSAKQAAFKVLDNIAEAYAC